MIDSHTPAFPSPAVSQNAATGETTIYQSEAGMSLRDYFAAQSISHCLPGSGIEQARVDEYASWAYRMADAMMKAREA